MKSFSSILMWLLLAALVAVPSFLFYNWIMQGKQKAAAETTSAGPVANVFPPAQDGRPAEAAAAPAAKPSPAAQAPAGPAAQQAPAAPAAKPSPAAQAPAGPAAQPPAAAQPDRKQPQARSGALPAASQAPSASANAPALSTAAAQQPLVSTGAAQGVDVSTAPKPRSWYEPKGDRDPIFTPEDYRRLREAELARAEAERLARYAAHNKPREPGPETRILLQGIVGNAALINNDMYYAGQTVRGIKIVKIGPDYVLCECVSGSCKGKKFKKVLK